jgi:hypothetical protein
MAETWKRTFSATPSRRKKRLSQHTVFSLVRGFPALWQTWFMDKLGICAGNPWQNVEPPKTDKLEVKLIDEETLTHFFDWLDRRYFGWVLPRLFLEIKAVTGCCLMDLCCVQSSQLRDGRLHFRADQTKGRKARSVKCAPGAGPVTFTLLVMPGSVFDASNPSFVLASVQSQSRR